MTKGGEKLWLDWPPVSASDLSPHRAVYLTDCPSVCRAHLCTLLTPLDEKDATRAVASSTQVY